MKSSISRVHDVIRRRPGALIAKGELTLDPGFARAFLDWKTPGSIDQTHSDLDLVVMCSRALGLDLVCVQSGDAEDDHVNLTARPSDLSTLADQGLFVFWVVNGAFQLVVKRKGMMELMTDLAIAPDDVSQELRNISHEVITTMATGVRSGAHGVIIADDIAYSQSTFISPEAVEQLLFPLWSMQVRSAHELGVPVFFHSDGNLRGVLQLIEHAGFDGLQCVDATAGMTVQDVKAHCGTSLCLMGMIDPGLLCEPLDRNDVETRHESLHQAVSEVLTLARTAGGVILGTSSGLHSGMSPERVALLYRLAAELEPTIEQPRQFLP